MPFDACMHRLLAGAPERTVSMSVMLLLKLPASYRSGLLIGAHGKARELLEAGVTCRKERARAVTAVFGSLDVGSAVGLLVCGPLIHAFGWPSVFYLFAALGLVWSAAWPLLKPEARDPDVPAPPPSSAPSVSGALPTRAGQNALLRIMSQSMPVRAV